MKKIILAAVTALAIVSTASAQVKNYVGVVREKHYKAFDEFLDELASNLKNRGYASYSDYVKSYRKGGFGSGFVYVDKDGKNYVITNRHVVSQAESASIEFENDDGSTKKFENLSVLITDDDIDIAVLTFEGNAKPFKSSLSFNTSKLSDGQDVISAGFPGLGGEPVWQFGKGSVTNASARIKDLIDPTISTVIQHSAQIDAGNSGGPLLVASKSAATGYEVAGINTWKAVGRDATNFSIPAKLALGLIEKSKNPPADETMLSDRKKKFKNALSDSANDYTSIVKFVSYNLASSEGSDCLDEVLRHASSAVVNRIAGEFAYNPIEGLRYALAYKIFDDLSDENVDEEKLSKIVWKKEHGLYRIDSTGNEGKKKSKSSSSKSAKKNSNSGIPEVEFKGFKTPYLIGLNGGMTFLTATDTPDAELQNTFDFALNVYPFESGIWGLTINVQRGNYQGDSFTAFGSEAIFRIPINFNMFCISPKAGAGVGFAFGDLHVMQFYWDAGVEAMFDFGWSGIKPGIEVSYKSFSDKYEHFGQFDSETVKGTGVSVKLVLAFAFE